MSKTEKIEDFVPTPESEEPEEEPKNHSEWENCENSGSFVVDEEEEEERQRNEEYEQAKTMTELELLRAIAYQLKRIADSNEQWRKFLMREGHIRKYEKMQQGDDTHNLIPNLFPSDLRRYLVFKDEGDETIISLRQYVGSDNFKKILSIVREAGGEYHSAGKNSYFSIPK